MVRKTLKVKKYYSKNFSVPALQVGTGDDRKYMTPREFYGSFKKFRIVK